MKNLILLLLTLSSSVFMHAQDFQGIATYQSKTSVDLNLDGRQISEAQKERIKERMKNAANRTYNLSFDRTAALYLEEEKLETPTAGNGGGGRGGFRAAFGAAGGGDLYKNIQHQSYTNQTELFGKVFLIKDSLTNWKWKLGSETKKIGNYTAYKATSVHQADSTITEMFSRLRGRRGPRGAEDGEKPKKETVSTDSTETNSLLSRIEAPKERVITAWYSPEIPVSQGPAKYWGLPGLILEVNDGRTAILCTKIVLNPADKVKIKEPSKGKEVSQEEYDKITAEKMKDMSERFRGGNRGGGNGRPRG